jgi:hypothetical protein
MPCGCQKCVQYFRVLGIEGTPSSKAAIRRAYKLAAKSWHPDRFESNPELRLKAEEKFKLIQIAYRELAEHAAVIADMPSEQMFVKHKVSPSISFGNAPGCFTAPHIPVSVQAIISQHLGAADEAVGIVDLTASASTDGAFSQFFLLCTHGLMVKNAFNVVSLLWYKDLGKIELVDYGQDRRLKWWMIAKKFFGFEQRLSLIISKMDDSNFYTLSGQMDDRLKKVIYTFLLQKKHEAIH